MAIEADIRVSRRNNSCYWIAYVAGAAGLAAGASYYYYCQQVANGFFQRAVQNGVDRVNRNCRRNAANGPLPVYSGKKVGTTSISVFDQNMQLVELLDLEVTIDTRNLQEKIRASGGTGSIRVSSSNGEVVLSGMAPDAVTADRAVSIARTMVKAAEIVNAMTVAPSQQVMLKVRFLEAARCCGARPWGQLVRHQPEWDSGF